MLVPMGMSASAAAAYERFRVELEKLRATATDLQGEVDSMYGVSERMSGTPNFGDSGIASVSAIGPRHDDVSKKMQKLLADIHGGIAAGESALVEVATRYEAADSQGEERMREAGRQVMEENDFDNDEGSNGSNGSNGPGGPGSPGPGGTGGPMRPI